MQSVAESFLRLVDIMEELRSKCPWDKKQTIHTLRSMTLEESYELSAAVSESDWKGIREELGDLLLHIVFYSQIGKEEGKFNLEEVITGICDKLVARHPHVYGDIKADTADEVKRNWENLKLKEGKKSVLSGVPDSMPALIKAIRLQEKARQVGFEWDIKEQVWNKVEEEAKELQHAVASGMHTQMEDELGDMMFSLINYARFLQVDAESALERTNQKFISRFTSMETKALASGRNLNEMTLEEMDVIWNALKKQQS